MSINRIVNHPVLGKLENETPLTFTFDGKPYTAYEGDTIASALLANGIRTLRVQEEAGTARGIYCNIGHCFECRVTVNDTSGVRACLQVVEQGMRVDSGSKLPAPFKETDEANMPRTYNEYTQTYGNPKGAKSND